MDGVFNADPHAGNFLLLDDGRVGLIDFGATKRLTRGERLVACVIYAALKRRDKEMVKAVCMSTGFKSKYVPPSLSVCLSVSLSPYYVHCEPLPFPPSRTD